MAKNPLTATITENQVKNDIIHYLLTQKALILRVNSGAVVGQNKGNRRFLHFVKWYAGGQGEQTAGVSDILAILPIESGGAIPLAIECKRPGKESNVSEAQQRFMDEWRNHGGITVVASSVDELVIGLMEALGNG